LLDYIREYEKSKRSTTTWDNCPDNSNFFFIPFTLAHEKNGRDYTTNNAPNNCQPHPKEDITGKKGERNP
jgi:hypothetical protein